MFKLPLFKIIAGAFVIPWYDKGRFSRRLVLPTLLLVVIMAIWMQLESKVAALNWSFLLLYWIAFSIFAVTCHRLILIDDNDSSNQFQINLSKREFRFLLRLIAVYLVMGMVLAVFMTILMNLSIGTEPVVNEASGEIFNERMSQDAFEWYKTLAYIPALYVVGRISLVFPSTAIDQDKGIKWSWQATKGNGMRMFVIVCVLPWLMSILLGLFWRENATLVEQALLGLIAYIVMAIEIFALSLTYKEFQKMENVEI